MSDYEKISCLLALNLVDNQCLVQTGKVMSAEEWINLYNTILNNMCNPFKLTNSRNWYALRKYVENHL